MYILQIILVTVGFFLLEFLEHFFLSLFNFRILFVLFLFGYKKIDWKILLLLSGIIAIIIDVTMHYRLGTNLLLFVIPVAVLSLFSVFFSLDEGVVSYVLKFVVSIIYYVSNALLPSLLLDGKWGVFNGNVLLVCIMKALITVLLLFLLDMLMDRFRKRGNTSQIRLK